MKIAIIAILPSAEPAKCYYLFVYHSIQKPKVKHELIYRNETDRVISGLVMASLIFSLATLYCPVLGDVRSVVYPAIS